MRYLTMKKLIHKLAYKAGKLSTKSPKLSFNPFKLAYNSFKQGRKDVKDSGATTTVVL